MIYHNGTWIKNTTHNYYNGSIVRGIYSVYPVDKQGYVGEGVTIAIFPPVAKWDCWPEIATPNEIIFFTASDSYSLYSNIINYTWDFGDGIIGYGMNVTHVYTQKGIYNVTLTIYNDEGFSASLSKIVKISHFYPIANFSWSPFIPKIGETIYFKDLSYDIDGQIINYTWYFGDGNISYVQNATHLYSKPGRYNVTLIVTDDDGAKAIMSKQIIIPAIRIISLPIGWSLFSIPFNESISLQDIIVSSNNTNYTWQEAIEANLIMPWIYTVNRSNGMYETVDELKPGYGYWIYCYMPIELWINGTYSEGNYINPSIGWNLVGIPSIYNISLNNLTIIWNNNSYSWQEAIESGLVMPWIYTVNRITGMYEVVYELKPGYGYWVYCYEDVEIRYS